MLTVTRLALAVAVGLTFATVAGPAHAGDPIGSVDCVQNPTNPMCSIEVGTPDESGSPGSGGSVPCRNPSGVVVPCHIDGVGWLADDGCYYQPATGVDLAGAEALGGPAPPPSRWYVGQCGYPPVVGLTRFRLFGSPPGLALLAEQAVKALRPPAPAIRLNPMPPVAQLVRLPSWVWLDPSSWGPRTATASVPGMSVTATATPTKVVFSAGDGTSFTCTGPGTAWRPGMNPAAKSPTCGHIYTRAGTFTLTATVTWAITWAGGGETGTAPALTTTSSLGVRVTESQALVTR